MTSWKLPTRSPEGHGSLSTLGGGLAARDPEVVRRELRFLAERGWLRSYVLKSDGVPCFFIFGHQYESSFYAESVGVDDTWRSYSAGTVMLLLVLENLFKENPPEFYDFGTPLEFQGYFATESYPEARVWLFRRRAYSHSGKQHLSRMQRSFAECWNVIGPLGSEIKSKASVMVLRATIQCVAEQ